MISCWNYFVDLMYLWESIVRQEMMYGRKLLEDNAHVEIANFN